MKVKTHTYTRYIDHRNENEIIISTMKVELVSSIITVIHVDNHKVPSPPPSKVSDSDNTAITGASASIVPLLL